MPFTDEHKHELEKKIVETLIGALEKNELVEDQLSIIAGRVLERIDTLSTQDELAEFLTELCVEWPMFQQLLEIELGKVKSEVEKKVAHEVLLLANSGKIEEAIRLAKTMTEQQT